MAMVTGRPPKIMADTEKHGNAPASDTDPVPEENPIEKTEQVRKAKHEARDDQ